MYKSIQNFSGRDLCAGGPIDDIWPLSLRAGVLWVPLSAKKLEEIVALIDVAGHHERSCSVL